MRSSLTETLRGCLTRVELTFATETALRALVQGHRHRLFFFDQVDQGTEVFRVLSDLFLGSETAVHEALLLDNSTWRRYCPRADHGHVMVGPIVCRCEVVGALAVTRQQTELEFGDKDLAQMNRLCLFASNRLAEIESGGLPFGNLTPREYEIAQLVRGGLRNAEIASRLYLSEHTIKQNLKNVFRKLGVRSRTQLARV